MSNKPIDWISENIGDPTSTNFGNMSQYPNSLVVGDKLFPLLYIYFLGDRQRQRRVTNTELFNKALEDSIQNEQFVHGISDGDGISVDNIKRHATRFSHMLDNVLQHNSAFVWALREKVNSLLNTHRARIPNIDIKTTGGTYYTHTESRFYTRPEEPDPRVVCSRVPFMLNDTSFKTADSAMETLRILLENGIIGPDTDLGIRPVNLYNGQFAEETPLSRLVQDRMREIGLPPKGAFSVNNLPKSTWMYHTFSGIDMKCVASIGDVVSELNGLTTLSWSIHRGKQTQRTLGKSSPSGRAAGNRTIAGTMIFAISDHHPLQSIIPNDYPVAQNMFISKDPRVWKPMMLADEIPPFDLVIVSQNEYGFASCVTLYGIEVVDEGVTVGIDNLITELVIQYTAVHMDPIHEIPPDESGVVDPFNILSSGVSNIHRRRESVIAGAAGDVSLHEQWENHMDSVHHRFINKIQQTRNIRY